MQGTGISQQERHSRLMNKFDKFVTVDGESLTFVYERFTTLINIMDRNNVLPKEISINTKLLNSLQPKWSKYVTMTHQKYVLGKAHCDEIYDHPSQFEQHVKASKAKKAPRNHDPLALVTNSQSHSLYSHASSLYSHSPQLYYATHPSSVIDNDDDYQGEIQRDAQENKLSIAMMNQVTNARNGLVRSIEEYDQNVQRVPRTKSSPRKENVHCYNCNAKGHYARKFPKPKVRDAKYLREQMLLTTKDEAKVHLDEEENDFMLDNAYGDHTLEELNEAFISEVNASQINMINGLLSKSDYEQCHHEKLKTIIHTSADDQINSDIILDDPYVDYNSGQAEHDTNPHDQSFHDFESLLNNVQIEAEKQRKMNIELKKKTTLLQQELEMCKEHEQLLNEKEEIREELLKTQDETLKIKHETDLYKKAFKERENKYLEDIISLEEKIRSNDRIVYKMSHSLQTILMLDQDRSFIYDDKVGIRRLFMQEVVPISKTLNECSKAIKHEIIEEVQEMLETFESTKRKVKEKSQKDKLFQNEINRHLEASLEREVKDCVLKSVEKQKNEMLMIEMEKISNESKDIQVNLLKRIKILENDFQRSQAQSIDFELKLQHQKEQTACDISWNSKMAKLNGENVSLHIQIESLVQEHEKIKLEYQKIFNTIKMTRVQHQQEVNELIENVNQKTYAYGDVHAKNQDLLMTISELKAKLKIVEKGKNVNTKFDKSATLEKLICVTLLNKNKDLKAKIVSKVEVKSDKSKPVTLCSTPKNEHEKKMNDVFMNFHDKCASSYALSLNSRVKKALLTSYVAVKSSKLGATPVVAKYRFSVATSPKATNKVSRATSLTPESRKSRLLSTYKKNKIATSSKWQKWFKNQQSFNWSPKSLAAQTPPCVTKSSTNARTHSRTPVTNQKWVAKLSTIPSSVSSCGVVMGIVCFGNDHFVVITGYGDYVQRNLMICHVYYVEGLGHNLFSVGQFCDGDLEVAFRSKTCYIWNLKGEDLLTSARDSNLYTISISEWRLHIQEEKKAIFPPKLVPRPGLNYSNFQDSSKELNEIPSKEDLDNLFSPLYEEYYATRTPEVSDNSAANTLDNEDTLSSSLIIVEDHDAPQLVSSSEEPIANKPTTLLSDNHFDEQVQEDITKLNINTFMNPFGTPDFEKSKSSSNYQDPSNMHEFHQQHRFTDRWTKNHPIEQVIGDPSKPVTTSSRLCTNAEMCMYALTVSTTEPTNIKEAMLDYSWIESMQDELNQFKRFYVWELVERPVDHNVIKVKWLWKNKTDA
ncbi:integrase, catalytic region, zinc finger, CCHC-type containing protein [Tanacetum coccineum]